MRGKVVVIVWGLVTFKLLLAPALVVVVVKLVSLMGLTQDILVLVLALVLVLVLVLVLALALVLVLVLVWVLVLVLVLGLALVGLLGRVLGTE